MTRSERDGTVFYSWVDTGLGHELIAKMSIIMGLMRELDIPYTYHGKREDLEIAQLDGDQIDARPIMLVVGGNGASYDLKRSVREFAKRHGVKHVFHLMSVETDSAKSWAELRRRCLDLSTQWVEKAKDGDEIVNESLLDAAQELFEASDPR